MNCVIHTDEFCHTYERVVWHIWMGCVMRMNELWHTVNSIGEMKRPCRITNAVGASGRSWAVSVALIRIFPWKFTRSQDNHTGPRPTMGFAMGVHDLSARLWLRLVVWRSFFSVAQNSEASGAHVVPLPWASLCLFPLCNVFSHLRYWLRNYGGRNTFTSSFPNHPPILTDSWIRCLVWIHQVTLVPEYLEI